MSRDERGGGVGAGAHLDGSPGVAYCGDMPKKHPSQPTTLDDLAAMINQGFTKTQKYIDKRLDTMDQRWDDMKGILKDVVQELNATHEDVRYTRTTVNLLVRNDVAQDAAIKTLSARVARLEKKVGLAN